MAFPMYKFSDDGKDDFDIPDRNASEEDILDFGNKCYIRGLQFLKLQAPYPDISKGREIVHSMETYTEPVPDKLSHVRVPRIKRQIKEIVATLSNLRPTSDYTANDPTKYENNANVLNKLYRAWYFGEKVDRSIRSALQYAGTEGTGYLYIYYDKPLRSSQGRIKLMPLSADSYVPYMQGSDSRVQNTEVGCIVTELPVKKAREMYNRSDLQPTSYSSMNSVQPNTGIRDLISNVVSIYLRVSGQNRRRGGGGVPMCKIYHLYIKDNTVNRSGQPIKMGNFDENGKPLDNMSYTVPSVGSPILTGLMVPSLEMNPGTGEPVLRPETRPATEADCLLYPNLRLIIMTPDTLISDGPSPWWHGKIPVVQFRFDDWAWNFLGFSLVRDTWRLEESINTRLRARDDSMNARLNPFLLVSSRMSDEFNEKVTPRIPGGRAVKPEMVDKPVEPLLPVNFYDVPPNCDVEIMSDEKRLDFLMGVSDLDALMRLKQMPQSDTLDKLIGASSNILIDIARNMESSIQDLGELWKYMAFQFCTTAERLRLLGTDGLVMEDFDFDPGNMIPSHLPGEDTSKPSRATRAERARQYVDSFQFNVVPNSLTQITAITRKMAYLQLWRDKSFPMDPWTFAEEWEIPNMGPPPQGAQNMIDRWKAWLPEFTKIMVQAQQAAQGVNPDIANAIGGNGNQPGRPPTAQVAPHFEQKSDGRQTIAES